MLAMEANDPKIADLGQMVTAAHEEFDMAIAFHEVWKPAAYDHDLHDRLGTSYATQAFLVARTALRRETVLALLRLWDSTKHGKHVRMQSIAAHLREKGLLDALARERAEHLGLPEAVGAMRDDLGKKANAAVQLIHKYMEGGARHAVLKKLSALRHERLAHRQLASAASTGANATDEEIEEFYRDNAELVHLLLSLVNAMAYNPEDTAKVFRHYAGCFWGRVQNREGKGKQAPLDSIERLD
jgi:hypothetical protein